MRTSYVAVALMMIGVSILGCSLSAGEVPVVDINAGGEASVISDAEHFSIFVKGTINDTYDDLKDIDLLDYEIRIFVRPVNDENWWRQKAATAKKTWQAQAYLGGEGPYSAENGERFQIVAILTTPDSLKDRYDRVKTILSEPDTFKLSPIKDVMVQRPRR